MNCFYLIDAAIKADSINVSNFFEKDFNLKFTFVEKNENNLLFFRRNISTYSDSELLQLFKETGKSDYFGELYNRYIPLLYGWGLKYLQEEEKAQDAVMQWFEDLLPKLSRYEIREFRTWIYSVAKNHCFQLLRKENLEIATDFDRQFVESYDLLHLLDKEETSDDARTAALKHCLEKLPEPQQRCILSFFMEEMSYVDIVEQTGYQLKSVKSYIQNGKRNLKSCIEKRMAQ